MKLLQDKQTFLSLILITSLGITPKSLSLDFVESKGFSGMLEASTESRE